jgi:HYDIN/CFA65/VesB family protein
MRASALDFGAVAEGARVTRALLVENVGTAPLVAWRLEPSEDVFGATPASLVLEPGAVASVEVSFTAPELIVRMNALLCDAVPRGGAAVVEILRLMRGTSRRPHAPLQGQWPCVVRVQRIAIHQHMPQWIAIRPFARPGQRSCGPSGVGTGHATCTSSLRNNDDRPVVNPRRGGVMKSKAAAMAVTAFVKRNAFIAAALAALSGCTLELADESDGSHHRSKPGAAGAGGSDAQPPGGLPGCIGIEITGALLQPWDGSGQLWDDTSYVSPEDVGGLATALGAANPYGAVAAFVYDFASSYYAPPDPYGYADLFVNGAWQDELTLALDDPDEHDEDTCAPGFDNARWDHVALESSIRIEVTLIDRDWNKDDSIGTIDLDYECVVGALESGGVYPCNTHDQGLGTILFVTISAVPEDC